MKYFRAIRIGIIIWIIGVSVYNISFFLPILENPAKQANTALFIAVIPLVWYGARQYYEKDNHTQGYRVGLTFFLIAAILDALITVPLFIIPYGDSHYEFFTDLGFWLIGLEFIAISALYWFAKVYTKRTISNFQK
ncbi:DUF5367 family protein [uncultured Maribacter sp.]|uniref:DUF5367 family protein n=1 Tax=uncultured Maribacter sp. TaxID=431308 RepID=UPI00260EB3FF|nr:DUF5367 family protein [uncultured Maribacter sp.]